MQIKAIINDIEPKLDKNSNSYYKITLQGFPDPFYAFANDYNLSITTLRMLKDNPEKLVNQLVLITYEEMSNQNNPGTFKKVKEIEIR
jgi:hypothetical protein